MKFCHLAWCMYKRSLSGFDIYFSALVEITTQNQLIILKRATVRSAHRFCS